jgi:hypothetical protein
MFTVTKQEMRKAYDRVEEAKSKLDSLFYIMEDAERGETPQTLQRYVNAKHLVDHASHKLLEAMDLLRTSS